MKVLQIGQLPTEIGGNYTTGAANVVYELSKQKTYDVVLYTYGTNIRSRSAKKFSSYKNQYLGYKYHPLRIILHAILRPITTLQHILHYKNVDHQNIIRYLFYEYNIRKAIDFVQPDLIHVHSIANISPVRFAIDNMNIPILLTCHGIFYRGENDNIQNRDRHLGNIMLADAYSGLTNESLDEYESILSIPKNRVTVIPNGVDCKKFYFSQSARDCIRKAYGVSNETMVFITVASVQERKGQFAFLKLLSTLNVNFIYWIVGRGPDEEKINLFVLQNNLQDRVRLLGYKKAEDLYKYYSAADIYAHPSWKEGQSLSELEANASGLRTIVNKAIVGTIASDVNTSDYYVLNFENIDKNSITKWILKDQTKRTSRTTFDWSYIAKQYACLYHKIINNK